MLEGVRIRLNLLLGSISKVAVVLAGLVLNGLDHAITSLCQGKMSEQKKVCDTGMH